MELYPFNNIDRFGTFFRGHVEAVGELPDSEHHRRHKKILYLSIMDAVSKAVFPGRTNRDRLTSLIRRFSDWPDAERVSLPHLQQLLAKNPEPAFEKMRIEVNSLIAKWPTGQQVPLSSDPLVEDIKRIWPKDKDARTPIEGVILENLQHWSLLYAYRNQLVHELQTPGHGLDHFGGADPFYIRVEMGDPYAGPQAIYHLAYHVEHFHRLCDSAVRAVNDYLTANRLDPLVHFRGGSFFLEELN